MGSNPVAVTSLSDFAPASSKEFLDIQATIECGFTLKRVRDMIKTYSQIYEVFDANQSLEVGRVFLDLSSAFDKVWHDGFMYKLKHLGICKNTTG